MKIRKHKLGLMITWLTLAALLTMVGRLTVSAQGPGDWTEYTGNPTFGEGVGGPKAYYPSVLYDPDEFSGHGASAKYKMWYGTSSSQTALATSDDGISWTDQGVVISNGYHATVEYYSTGFPGADSGSNPSASTMYYRMWYWPGLSYDISDIRYAESSDGTNWCNDQPLQNGAVPIIGGGELSSGGSGRAWNRGSYGPCDVLYDPGAPNTGTDWVFTMYYDGTTGGDEAIGLGFSADGITWSGHDPDSNGKANAVLEGTYVSGDWDENYVSRATIIKSADDDYEMWYSGGVGAMDHGIGYATSSDGMNWTRDANNPILHKDDTGYPGEPWRQTRTYCPSVIKDGSAYKMWFAGKGSGYSIGYATASTAPSEAWVDDDYDDASCTADGHTWQYDCFASIQDGIDAVEGSTVHVGPGTYDSTVETFPIVIDKSLTLLGAQANVDPRPSQGGRSGSESIIDADETSGAVLRISDASDVEINGFTITGGTGDMVEESGSADNLLFRYNILYDDLSTSGDEAIQIKYSDGVVMEYNYAYDILQDGFNLSDSTNGVVRYNEVHDIYSVNAAIYCYGTTDIDIIGNLVYDVPDNDGIKLGDSGDGSTGGEVKDNVAHHCAEDGITIYASGVTVENNTIHDCDSENGALYLYLADNSTVTGNEIYDNNAIGLLMVDTDNVTVGSNLIYHNDDSDDTKYSGSAGIWITSDCDASTIAVNASCMYGNADNGLRNDDTSQLDAENNYWGCPYGPGSYGCDTVTGLVDYDPYLGFCPLTPTMLDATPFAYDETIPRGVDGDAPTGWGDSCWQGPETGKSNYHVWYTDITYGSAVDLEDLFGVGHGLTVADLEAISYHTKKGSSIPADRDWWLTIYTQETGSDDEGSWYKSRLHARPDVGHSSYSFTYDAWNLWSTDDTASATNQLLFYDSTRTPSTYETLAELTDGTGRDYSSELLKSITLQTDSGWNGFDGYIDGLTIELKDGSIGQVNMIDGPKMGLEIGDPGWLATCEDETITVDVLLTANGFNGVQFDLDFDETLLEVVDADGSRAGTQISLGTMWPASVTDPQNSVDATNGVIEFGAYIQQADTNISATDGQVARITFKELDTKGNSALDFNDVIVSNSEGQQIPVTLEDSALEIKGCGCVEGVVEVQGRFGPRWDGAEVKLLGGPGGTYGPVTTNSAGQWDICDLALVVEGDYDVEVEMALYLDALKTFTVPGDGSSLDAGQVKVLGGDCNDSDGVQPCGAGQEGINTLDATTVGGAFGAEPGDPNWNEDGDINDDDKVDILDASLLGGNWHKCSPVPW